MKRRSTWIAGSSLALAGTLAGCASTVPYEAKEGVLQEVPAEDARVRFAEVVARCVEPPVVSVDVGDEELRYVYKQVIHGPFGIPVGHEERQQVLPYVRVRRVELYDNDRVYVHGDRLMAKLLFDDPADARSFADLLMSFRHRRLFGGRPQD